MEKVMRAWVFAGVLFAAGCDAAVTTDGGTAPAGEGYTMEIRASELEQTYLITAPDGRVVAARAAEGASALMNSSGARALAADPPPQGEEVPEVMSLRVPGFEMSIGATEDGTNGEQGRVALSIGGDGERIEVNANEGGPGGADDRAYVRISGADEQAVREFISHADELSPAVQAQMLAQLGLD
jgi:hypothetical protein